MLNRLKSSKTSRQTLFLFFAQIFGMAIGLISGLLIAKGMGSFQFGLYSFAVSVISFIAIFFEFGYFASASRLLTQCKDTACEKELLGASLVVLFIISTAFVLTILLISFLVDFIFKDKVGDMLLIASFVSFGYVLPFFMELVLKGSNHIEQLSIFNIIWRIVYTVVIVYLYIHEALAPANVIIISATTCIVSAGYIIYILRPSFQNLKMNLTKIQNENKIYGLHIYTGRVIDVSTYQLDKILIGYFIGARDVGQYNLANSMASPINSFSSALSSSKFKDMASSSGISSSVLKMNFGWIALALLGANILGYIIVHYYLGSDYHDVYLLLFLMSIAVAFQAAYQPYNAWLSANGYGKEMKKMSYFMAFFNFVGNISLIPYFGAIGAAFASILGTLVYLIVSLKYYKRFKHE